MNAIEREAWQVVQDWNRAFAANDPDTYFTYIDEEIVVIIPSNPYRIEVIADDREEFEFGLRMGYSRMGYFQEMQPRVDVYGEVAVVTYYSRGSYGVEGKTRCYKETNILVKRATGWKVVHIHLSSPPQG